MSDTEKPDLLEQMTLLELRARFRDERASFATLWHGLDAAQMQQVPGPQADWSVKDLIAHIVWWEDYALCCVALLLTGQPAADIADDDAINAQVHAEYKAMPLETVLALFAANQTRLEAQLSLMNDTTLHRIQDGLSPLRFYIGNTWGHYEDHRDDLRRYVMQINT